MRSDETGIFNGRDIPRGTTLEPDVCVIGAGPAGISTAWKLAEAGLSVILLDGSRQLNYPPPLGTGGDSYYQGSWPDKAKLYKGVATGIFAANEPNFLILPTHPSDPAQPWERERVFGGTPTHGGGQCRPHDPVDMEGRVFEGKTIFPRWPIPAGELDEAYREASVANYLSGNYPDNFTAKFWEEKLELTDGIPKVAGFDVEMYQFMGKWKNFATRPWGKSQQTINHFVQVIVNATVLNIVVGGGWAHWLEVAGMEDKYPDQNPPGIPKVATTFKVVARFYILACGAVENARQLLLSEIGNKNVVGHYFMCHPLSGGSIIKTTQTYLHGDEIKLLQGNDKNGQHWSDPDFGNNVEGRFITDPETTRTEGIGRCWFWANNKDDRAQMYFEMAPNYESHVSLDDDGPRDPVFGQKRAKIHWCLDDITDKRTYNENCEKFNSNFGGIISYPPWEDTKGEWIVNGHHMGTTRMSVKPEEGVVDENLKVHGVDNLYVAGSSVFPSGAISNPTFTIVALSLRLASHLRERFGKPRAVAAQAQSKGAVGG